MKFRLRCFTSQQFGVLSSLFFGLAVGLAHVRAASPATHTSRATPTLVEETMTVDYKNQLMLKTLLQFLPILSNLMICIMPLHITIHTQSNSWRWPLALKSNDFCIAITPRHQSTVASSEIIIIRVIWHQMTCGTAFKD